MSTRYRYTSTGCEYICRPDPGRIRNDGSRFETGTKRMSRIEAAAWMALFASITGAGIAASLYLAEPPANASDAAPASSSPASRGIEAIAAGNRDSRS